MLRTPDFDHYLSNQSITEVISVTATTVTVRWSDGRVDRHHPWTLRENSTDPTTTGPVTRERLLDADGLGDDIAVKHAELVPSGVRITWLPDGLVSDYDTRWLRHLGGTDWRPDAIRPDPALWDESPGAPITFDGPSYLTDDGVLTDALQAFGASGLVRLRGLPTEYDAVRAVAERIGVIRPSQFGPDFVVHNRPDADSEAYTDARLAPHTDMPTRETQPGLQVLHCVSNTVVGGNSVMVDGFAVAEHLRHHQPDTFDALTTLPWVWANRSRETDLRWSGPIIALDGERIDEIRFTNALRLFPDTAHEDTERAYRALGRFAQLAGSGRFEMTFPFQPGDCVLFDNRRILHGREAFDAGSGERCLRGCYIDRDDVLSRLRILARARRQQTRAASTIVGPAS